jgi:hypothetical protein
VSGVLDCFDSIVFRFNDCWFWIGEDDFLWLMRFCEEQGVKSGNCERLSTCSGVNTVGIV